MLKRYKSRKSKSNHMFPKGLPHMMVHTLELGLHRSSYLRSPTNWLDHRSECHLLISNSKPNTHLPTYKHSVRPPSTTASTSRMLWPAIEHNPITDSTKSNDYEYENHQTLKKLMNSIRLIRPSSLRSISLISSPTSVRAPFKLLREKNSMNLRLCIFVHPRHPITRPLRMRPLARIAPCLPTMDSSRLVSIIPAHW
jgi:hypothetical protein